MHDADLTAHATTAADAAALIHGADGILLDWDGCLVLANRPRTEALAFIARHRARVAIVSNNSTHLPEDIAAILARSGIDFPAERIFLAGAMALAYAAQIPDTRALVLAAPRMKAWARRLGLTLVRSNPDTVVLLRDTKFSYAGLARATAALAQGARLIVSNSDTTHPGPGGAMVPETGALLAAIGACVDLSRIDLHCIGKPSPMLFEHACRALKTPTELAVMIGDNLHTDVEGARRLGMASILVAPGSALSFAELVEPGHESLDFGPVRRRPLLTVRPARPSMPGLN